MPTPRPVLHLICQAHLDPIWLWPLRDGIAETLTTLRSAVERAAENPGFRFTHSSACNYRWARECDPRLFRAIRALVRAGRWEVVGSGVDQPDCSHPSAESLVRQSLLARDFYRRAFGEDGETRIGYNVDSFGHAGGLPQILKLCGLDYYVFMRPDPENDSRVPLLFWWESPDGSRVLAQRIPIQYSQSYAATPDGIESVVRASVTRGFAPGFRHGLMFLGVGNHGGGPTRAHLARIRQLQADPRFPVEVRFSTMRDYFSAVEGDRAFRDLPVWREELQRVFRGCYSANAETKRQHRLAEKALLTAESLMVLDQGPRAAASLREAWWRLGLSQFHDILAGTCVSSVQEDIRSRFGAVLTDARELSLRATAALARRVDTRGEKGSVLFAANPLPWDRVALVDLDTFRTPHGAERIVGLETAEGRAVPIQWLRADANFGPWGLPWGKLVAALPLPAGGYRAFRVVTRPLDEALGQSLSQSEPTSDQFVRIDAADAPPPLGPVAARSALASLLLPAPSLRRRPAEALAAPVGFAVFSDPSGTWGHGVERYDRQLGRPESLGTRVLESGPLLEIAREKARWKNSELWLDVVRRADSRLVELRVRVNWQERREVLKLVVPTRLRPSNVFAKTCGGVTRRPPDVGESSMQDWVAVEGRLGRRPATFAVLNDSTHGYDLAGGELQFIVARGAPYAEHPPFNYRGVIEEEISWLDQGWQECRFWLLAASEPWLALDLDRLALEAQVPAATLLDSAHPGSAPWEASVAQIAPGNVSLLALKPLERGGGFVLRLQELAGRATVASGHVHGRRFRVRLKPWQIASVLLSSDSSVRLLPVAHED